MKLKEALTTEWQRRQDWLKSQAGPLSSELGWEDWRRIELLEGQVKQLTARIGHLEVESIPADLEDEIFSLIASDCGGIALALVELCDAVGGYHAEAERLQRSDSSDNDELQGVREQADLAQRDLETTVSSILES